MSETFFFTGTCGSSWHQFTRDFEHLATDAQGRITGTLADGPYLIAQPSSAAMDAITTAKNARVVAFCESPAAFLANISAQTGQTSLETHLEAWCESAGTLLTLWKKHRHRVHMLDWEECCACPSGLLGWLSTFDSTKLHWEPQIAPCGDFETLIQMVSEQLVNEHRVAVRLWREVQAASQPLSADFQKSRPPSSALAALQSLAQLQSGHNALLAEHSSLVVRLSTLASERDALSTDLQKHKHHAQQTHEMLIREVQQAFEESEGFFAELEATRSEVESLKADLETSRSEHDKLVSEKSALDSRLSALASEREVLAADLQKQKEQALQTHKMLLSEIHSAHMESEGFFEEWKTLEAATDFHHLQVGAVCRGDERSSPTHSHLDFSFERLELFGRRWPRLAARLVEHNGHAGLAIFDAPGEKDRPLFHWKPSGEEGNIGYMLFVPTDKPALDALVALPATDLVLVRCLTARILGHLSVHGESASGRWATVARRLLQQIEEIRERLHYDSIGATPAHGSSEKSIVFTATHLFFRGSVAERFHWTWNPGSNGGEIMIQKNEASAPLLLGWPLKDDTLRLGEKTSGDMERTRSIWNRLMERDRAFLRLLVDALPDCIHHLCEQHSEFNRAKSELVTQARILRGKLAALSRRQSVFQKIFIR